MGKDRTNYFSTLFNIDTTFCPFKNVHFAK